MVAVEAKTPEETSALWHKLAEGATVIVPLAPAQWSPLFGMLTDSFGVSWSLSVARSEG